MSVSSYAIRQCLRFLLVLGCGSTWALGHAADWVGSYNGTLTVGSQKLRMVLRLSESGGAPKGVLVVVDQGNAEIPLESLTLEEGSLSFEFKPLTIRYEGRFGDGFAKINGTFTQGSFSGPLDFEKTDEEFGLNRPQTPTAPFPYRTEEVTFQAEGGPKISGTLALPEGDGPFPVIVLLTGSGGQDRDETLMGHKPFLVLADFLARRGIGTLRADDRGMGKSEGSWVDSSIADYVEDARAGIKLLREDPRIDKDRIGVLGHSEGAIQAAMLAAGDPEIAFVVSVAGPGLSGLEVLRRQVEDMAKVSGTPPRMVEFSKSVQTMVAGVYAETDDLEVAREKISTGMDTLIAELPGPLLNLAGGAEALKAQTLGMTANAWFASFLATDPGDFWPKVRVPVLALNGKKDTQVAWEENLEAIARLVRSGGNEDVATVGIDDLNHLMQKAETGSLAEYATIEETLNEGFLNELARWLDRVVFGK